MNDNNVGYSDHELGTCQEVEQYIREYSKEFTSTMMTHKVSVIRSRFAHIWQ